MEDLFNLAAAHLEELISNSNISLKEGDLLYLYARYKQATVGPCDTAKPFFLDVQARKKWNCWNSIKTMSKSQAMNEYVQKIQAIDSSWDPNTATKPRLGLGVSVSTLNGSMSDKMEDSKKDVFDWCKEGALSQVIPLVLKGFPKDSENRTLLHWACDRGHLELVEYLIKQGHEVNCVDSESLTPLHYAASCDHFDIVEYLLEHNADPTAVDADGETPLVCAESEKIKQLLQDSIRETCLKTT